MQLSDAKLSLYFLTPARKGGPAYGKQELQGYYIQNALF